jgi:hypothetical protein
MRETVRHPWGLVASPRLWHITAVGRGGAGGPWLSPRAHLIDFARFSRGSHGVCVSTAAYSGRWTSPRILAMLPSLRMRDSGRLAVAIVIATAIGCASTSKGGSGVGGNQPSAGDAGEPTLGGGPGQAGLGGSEDASGRGGRDGSAGAAGHDDNAGQGGQESGGAGGQGEPDACVLGTSMLPCTLG